MEDCFLVAHRLRRPAMDETGATLIVSGTAPRYRGRVLLGVKSPLSSWASVDQDRTTPPTLIAALFYDLSPDKEPRISTQVSAANATSRSCSTAAVNQLRCLSTKPTTYMPRR